MITQREDGKIELCCWGLLDFLTNHKNMISFLGVIRKNPKLYCNGSLVSFCPSCGDKMIGDIKDDPTYRTIE